MWWSDIKGIKFAISALVDRLNSLEDKMNEFVRSDVTSELLSEIDHKVALLLHDENRIEQVAVAEKTLDKFEEYMKNVDKLNSMINEFKGCVSMARSAIGERRELEKETQATAVLADMTKEIYKAMKEFIRAGESLETRAHFKLDAIYKAICEEETTISCKKRHRSKKDHLVS